VFGIAQFDHVGTEGLFLRQTYGGGTGYDVTLRGRGTLSIFGGLTLVREQFSTSAVRDELSTTTGPDQTAQFLFGDKIRYQLTPRVRLLDVREDGAPAGAAMQEQALDCPVLQFELQRAAR